MGIDLDEYRRDSLANWNRLADNWREERDFLLEAMGPVARDLVERLDPQPGQTILELAAGTGDTGFEVAKRLGEDGRLISTDFSPAMVEHARAVGEELGIENVDHRVLDAENMDVDDDSIDGVICRFGYMLMADPAKALAETRRVLRDGGHLSFAVWAAPDRNPWASLMGMEMVSRGHIPPPEPGDPGIFGLPDPGQLEQLVRGAGFENVQVDDLDFVWPYDGVDEHWRLMLKLAGPLAEAVLELDEDDRESVRQAIQEKMEPILASGGAHGVTLNVTAS